MKKEVIIISNIEININNIKIMQMSGTASFVIGESYYEEQSSYSKTNNGVGSAYGDNSEIVMSPRQSTLYDTDLTDNTGQSDEIAYRFDNDRNRLFE